MRVFIAATVILPVAAASGAPVDQGEVLARSLQTTVLDHVRRVYRDYGRHLQTPELYDGEQVKPLPELTDWGFDMGGDFDICTIFDFLAGQVEAKGLSCSCSATDSALNLFCKTNENFNQDMLKSECGSMNNPTLNMSLSTGISFGDDISTHSEICATFGNDYKCVETLKDQTFCIGVGMTAKMPDFGQDSALGPDEIDINDFLQMDCNVEIEPAYDCQCDICDNFMGIEATCVPAKGSKIIMDCTDGFSISDPATEPGFGQESGMSIIDDFESSFIVPQFLEQVVAVTDSVDDNDEGNTGTDTGDDNDAGNSGNDTSDDKDGGNTDTDADDISDGEDGGMDSPKDDGVDMTGDGSDSGDGDVDATPAGDDSGGSFVRATYSLIVSAVVFVFLSSHA